MKLHVLYFAQVSQGYGCQGYGVTDAYNSCSVKNPNSLVNTGSPVMLTISVALLIIIAAVIVRFWPTRGKV